jgi:nucleotide-binding universal stress UspA family protein
LKKNVLIIGAGGVAHVAAHVARRMGAELTLAHVRTADRAASARAARELDVLAGDIAAAFGTRPDVRVVQGDSPAEGLTTTAQALASDLIVIGASARGRLAQALRAGTRDALAAQADAPVMVVPPGAASPTGNCVAVTSDTSGACEGAAAVAAQFAAALEGRLTVVHVLPDPRSYARSVLPMHRDMAGVVANAVDGEKLDLRHVFAYRLPAAHVAQTVAQLQPALLAVAAPKRGWRSLLRRSVGARLLRGARCPVVLVPYSQCSMYGSKRPAALSTVGGPTYGRDPG